MFNLIIKKIKVLWEKGAFHIIIGNFVTKFVAFFGSIFMVNLLSKETYGILSYIENIYGYLFIFAGLGLGNALLRFMLLKEHEELKRRIYNYVIVRGSIFNLIYISLAYVAIYYFDSKFNLMADKSFFLILLLILPIQYLFESNIMVFRSVFMNKIFATLTVSVALLVVINQIIGALIYNLHGILYAKLLTYVIAASASYLLLKKVVFKDYVLGNRISKSIKSDMNKYSVSLMITNAVWSLFMLNDIFLIGLLNSNPLEIAEYRVAYVLPVNLTIICFAIGVFVGPYFVQNEKNQIWVWESYKKLTLLVFIIITPIALVFFFFSNEIITFVFGSEYESAAYVMKLLTVAAYVNCVFRYLTAHLLATMGQVKYNMIFSIVGLLLQLILDIVLIPKLGGEGAAITSIIVYFVMAVALIAVFKNKYKLRI